MKSDLREEARRLRSEGISVRSIAETLGVAKSSVSGWVRDIELSAEQRELLQRNLTNRAKYSATMSALRVKRLAAWRDEADAQYEAWKHDPRFAFGLGLYAGEGHKTKPAMIGMTNCDPRIIAQSIKFYEFIGVARPQIKMEIFLHPSLCEQTALDFWGAQTGLPATQFAKVRQKVSGSSKGVTQRRQNYGICTVAVYSTSLHYKMMRWLDRVLNEGA